MKPFLIRLSLFCLACFTTSCIFYQEQTNPSIPIKTFYDTQKIKFHEPVWFGEYPGKKGAFIVGELGGDIFLLDSTSGEFKVSLFGHVPVAAVPEYDGLNGIAFHPDFANNRKYYVYYNNRPGSGVLGERMADSSFTHDAGYSRIILYSDSGSGEVHNGGDVHFGSDHFLYLAFGDGSFPNAYFTNPQDLHNLFGKMIRIDIDRKDAGREYAIPADNPFSNNLDSLVRKEIYAYGFRNPWRWNFDPLDGQLILGDVGNMLQEEVNVVTPGGNYGWRIREGNTCFNDSNYLSPLPQCAMTGMIPPIAVLNRSDAGNAIIGGVVYRGNPASPFYGTYFFGDYMTRMIWTLSSTNSAGKLSVAGYVPVGMSAFGTDTQGNIYVIGFKNGIIYRLTFK